MVDILQNPTKPNHIFDIYMYTEDSALNNQQGLLHHKTQPPDHSTDIKILKSSQLVIIMVEWKVTSLEIKTLSSCWKFFCPTKKEIAFFFFFIFLLFLGRHKEILEMLFQVYWSAREICEIVCMFHGSWSD